MKHMLMAVGVLALGLLVGCGPVMAEESEATQEFGAIPDGTQLSPEMRAAVLSQVPVPTQEMIRAATTACQAAKTCTGYDSCGSWSSIYNCGTLSTCNMTALACKKCTGLGSCEYTGEQKQGSNSYRVCFNAAGASCTEYAYYTASVCGCSAL